MKLQIESRLPSLNKLKLKLYAAEVSALHRFNGTINVNKKFA